MSSGALRHPRFTRQEVESSNGREHDKLWNTFLFLEPAGANAGTRGSISRGEGRADSQNGNPLGAVERLATRYGRDPREVIGEASHRFGRNKLRPSRMESRHPGGANATLGRDGVPPPSAARRDASPPPAWIAAILAAHHPPTNHQPTNHQPTNQLTNNQPTNYQATPDAP